MLRTKKTFLILLLSLLLASLALCAVPAFAAENNVRASGECGANGDNLTWTLTDDGVLTVSGTGAMKDYDKTEVSFLGKERAPWYEYRSEIHVIVLEDGVTRVGAYAFYVFPGMQSVQLPQSLNDVGEHAFDTDGAVNAVYYMAPIGLFGSINVQSNNERLLSAQRHSHVTGGGTSFTQQQNFTAATCTAAGGYDMIERCQYCQLVLNITHQTIPRKSHTPGEAVTENEVAATPQRDGRYDEVVYCVSCGTLLSRHTVTVPYVCPNHIPREAVFENEGYNEAVGSLAYDEVVYCAVCGAELSRVTYKTPYEGHRHTPGETRIQNEVLNAETGEVTYDELVYCSDCHYEISRTSVTGACPHTMKYRQELPYFVPYTVAQASDINYEDLIGVPMHSIFLDHTEPDGTGYHHYRVEYCALCGTALSMVEHPVYLRIDYQKDINSSYTGWKFHHVSLGCDLCNYEGVVEQHPENSNDITRTWDETNWEKPTCTQEGYRGYSVDCASCAQIYAQLLAQPQYRDDPSILGNAEHKFEEAIYGTVDYSSTEVLPATNHANAVTVPETAATATEHGHTEGVYCPDCETWLSGHEVIHNTLGERVYLDEYTEDGEQMVRIQCTVCGGEGLYAMEPIPPTEPANPDGGANGRPMSPISKAIQSIINFFLRLIQWFSNLNMKN